MMTGLKHQLASFLTDAARSGFQKLDKKSPLARELKGLDVETLLREDIRLICDALTFPEMMRAMSLVAKIKLDPKDAEVFKEEIKTMARAIVERVEKKAKINTPVSCRELLFNL
ncbi:MAG: hypothetical protein HQL22_05965 [Candidatus Omnitrophica bacterium]|nr:hypothetical protein [Candidatus Omnitrophota bacterium]